MFSVVLFKAMQNNVFKYFLFLVSGSVFLWGVCLHYPGVWSGFFFCLDRACIFMKTEKAIRSLVVHSLPSVLAKDGRF